MGDAQWERIQSNLRTSSGFADWRDAVGRVVHGVEDIPRLEDRIALLELRLTEARVKIQRENRKGLWSGVAYGMVGGIVFCLLAWSVGR
jgi:hypothetical protein